MADAAIKLHSEDTPGAKIDDVSVVAKWAVDKLKFRPKCRRLNEQENNIGLLNR